MFRKVSHLLRRKRGDLGRPGSRLHLDDAQEVEESKASLVQAHLPTQYFPDGPGEVSQASTFGPSHSCLGPGGAGTGREARTQRYRSH